MNEKRFHTLTKLRKEQNISMTEMAKKLHISTAYYCQLENRKKRLSYSMAIRISKILNLKPDDVFYNDVKSILQ